MIAEEQYQFEPTVFGAIRRHRTMVVAVTLLSAACAWGLTLLQPDAFRAEARITVPERAASAQDRNHLDGQVLLLESQDVAARAVDIVNTTRAEPSVTLRDFSGADSAVTISPPVADSEGTYGAWTIRVSFTWTDPDTATLGANAIVQAFDEVRSAAIRSTGDATIAAIQNAIDDVRNGDQRLDVLLAQRTQVLVDQQIDLANHPVVAWASEAEPINGSVPGVAIGVLVGAVLGALLAYMRASRRGGFDHSDEPAALYRAPLLGEIHGGRRGKKGLAELLPVTVDPQSSVAEAFRFAAGSVERSRRASNYVGRLAVVAPGTGDGGHFVLANLALALAESDTRVLVVDAADGTLSDLLLDDVPRADGVAQVIAGLRGVADCVRPSTRSVRPSTRSVGVDVLGSGQAPPVPKTGEAYGRAMEKLLADVECGYDVVLIDCPDILRVATSTALIDVCGAVLLVVGPDTPGRDHITTAHRLSQIDTDVLGYVYLRSPVPSVVRPGGSTRPGYPDPRSVRPIQSPATVQQPDPTSRLDGDGDDPDQTQVAVPADAPDPDLPDPADPELGTGVPVTPHKASGSAPVPGTVEGRNVRPPRVPRS